MYEYEIVTTKAFHIAQIFRLSVVFNTEFLHPHINVGSILHISFTAIMPAITLFND